MTMCIASVIEAYEAGAAVSSALLELAAAVEFSAAAGASAVFSSLVASAGCGSPSPPSDEVQSVRLSRSSCMINVLSRYDSSERESSSAIASSNACFARWHARSGEFKIS